MSSYENKLKTGVSGGLIQKTSAQAKRGHEVRVSSCFL